MAIVPPASLGLKSEVDDLVNVSEGPTSGTGVYSEISQIAPSENGRVWLFSSINPPQLGVL